MLLAQLLGGEKGFELVGTWGSATDFLAVSDSTPVDLLLVDLGLPGMSGIELIAAVTRDHAETSCIVLTSSSEQRDVSLAIRSGASGYIVKESSPKELIESIRSAKDGVILSPKIARLLVEEFRQSPDLGIEKPSIAVLTPREKEVLNMLASGLETKECATALSLSYETVRSHLKRIYQKLHVSTRTQAVARFMGH